jgi:hypothetical protein
MPWLESVTGWAAEPLRAAAGPRPEAQPPVRFACLFSGNGFHSREWWARDEGSGMELGKVLEPLAGSKEKLLFIRGLYNDEALKGNIHSSQTGNMLSGAPLRSGGDIRSGTSVDQVVAQHHGGATKLPSLVLGCEPSIASVHKDYSMLYSSHISWSSPTTPTPLELYPALAFDSLFRDESARTDRSVLDAVLEQARGLENRVSVADRRRLDEYLSSVREVEMRIERAGSERRIEGWRPASPAPTMQRPQEGLPQDIDEHMKLMCDLLVLAFQTDTTRVATLKLNNDHSSLRFPNIGVDYIIHHLLSHSDSADWLKVNQYFLGMVARVAAKMDAVQEGERTLLDNSVVLFCSSMLNGNHDATQLPVLVLGRGGGKIRTGRVIDRLGRSDRKMCSLYLSILDTLDIELERFGDSTERLVEFG